MQLHRRLLEQDHAIREEKHVNVLHRRSIKPTGPASPRPPDQDNLITRIEHNSIIIIAQDRK